MTATPTAPTLTAEQSALLVVMNMLQTSGVEKMTVAECAEALGLGASAEPAIQAAMEELAFYGHAKCRGKRVVRWTVQAAPTPPDPVVHAFLDDAEPLMRRPGVVAVAYALVFEDGGIAYAHSHSQHHMALTGAVAHLHAYLAQPPPVGVADGDDAD